MPGFSASTAAARREVNSSATLSWTKTSLIAVQRWPLKDRAPEDALGDGEVEVGVAEDDGGVLRLEPEDAAQAVGLRVLSLRIASAAALVPMKARTSTFPDATRGLTTVRPSPWIELDDAGREGRRGTPRGAARGGARRAAAA